MTSPPAHLLPLALEAMTSADACEVLGDALLESGWWDERVLDLVYGPYGRTERIKVDRALRKAWLMPGKDLWKLIGRPLPDHGPQPRWPMLARAIAAVLLFGDWGTARWPLVEAHEARQPAPLLWRYDEIRELLEHGIIDEEQARRLMELPYPGGR